MYSWNDIASRTEKVYNEIVSRTPLPLIDRLKRYYGCGAWAGKLFCLLMALDFLLLWFLELCYPRARIDIAKDWPNKKKLADVQENGKAIAMKSKARGKGKNGNTREQGGGRISCVMREDSIDENITVESMVNGTGMDR